jgi:hypothetical protein
VRRRKKGSIKLSAAIESRLRRRLLRVMSTCRLKTHSSVFIIVGAARKLFSVEITFFSDLHFNQRSHEGTRCGVDDVAKLFWYLIFFPLTHSLTFHTALVRARGSLMNFSMTFRDSLRLLGPLFGCEKRSKLSASSLSSTATLKANTEITFRRRSASLYKIKVAHLRLE